MILEKDVRQYGQRESGVCTHGGQVINGNRRMSVIESIFESDSNFKDLMVARLPPNISAIDLWKIEVENLNKGFSNIFIAMSEPVDDSWIFRFHYSPLTPWIWFGSFMAVLGGMLSFTRRMRKKK